MALGASLDNTIALADDRIMNAEGLRYPQEFVRHKMLDAMGDLALAGAPMLGAYRSVRGGHRLNAHVAAGAARRHGSLDDGARALGARGCRRSRCRWARPPSTTPPTGREAAARPVLIAPGCLDLARLADACPEFCGKVGAVFRGRRRRCGCRPIVW